MNFEFVALLKGLKILLISLVGIPIPLSETLIDNKLSKIETLTSTPSFENLHALSIRFFNAI